MKSQPGTTSMHTDSQIAESLKHAPGLVRRKANISIWATYYTVNDFFKTFVLLVTSMDVRCLET